jgi:hypothetical protein
VTGIHVHEVSHVIAWMGLVLLVSIVFMGALGPGDLILKEFYNLARALNQLVRGKCLGVV